MGVSIAASFLLRPLWGVGGLALANAIGVTVEVTTLLLILRQRWRTNRDDVVGESQLISL